MARFVLPRAISRSTSISRDVRPPASGVTSPDGSCSAPRPRRARARRRTGGIRAPRRPTPSARHRRRRARGTRGRASTLTRAASYGASRSRQIVSASRQRRQRLARLAVREMHGAVRRSGHRAEPLRVERCRQSPSTRPPPPGRRRRRRPPGESRRAATSTSARCRPRAGSAITRSIAARAASPCPCASRSSARPGYGARPCSLARR